MDHIDAEQDSLRDELFLFVTLLLGCLLLLVACLLRPGRGRAVACGWALSLRYPAQDLAGLTRQTRAAFVPAFTTPERFPSPRARREQDAA